MNTLDRLQECLGRAIEAARMERASFGFDKDRITVTSAHMGDFAGTKIKQGDAIHPTDFILEMTKLYRETWLIPPLEEALALVAQHQELLRQLQHAQETIAQLRLNRIHELADAGMRGNWPNTPCRA